MMKAKLLTALLPMTLLLGACSAYESVNNFVERAIDNPFTLLTGGKTLNHIMKWGYQNTYLAKLKGVHISELEKRGLIADYTLAGEGLYQLHSSYYGYGSGTTTNTYAVYGDGSRRLVHSHYDGGAIYFSVWVETDKNGIITDYKEEGNNPHELPPHIKNEILAIIGEAPQNAADTQIILVLNKSSGNWGVAVGGANDNRGELIMKAFASCISKDSGIPADKLKSVQDLLKHNKNDACKLADIPPPRAAALFRNELAQGYEFHGAFSDSNTVPDEEYRRQEQDCQSQGKNCRLLKVFGMNDRGKVF